MSRVTFGVPDIFPYCELFVLMHFFRKIFQKIMSK